MKKATQPKSATTRRSMFAGLMSLPAVAVAAVHSKHARVSQRELQSVIDLHNQAEVLAHSIRQRIEAGAEMERGNLGMSTHGAESLDELRTPGEAKHVGAVMGLTILPVEEMTYIFEMRKQSPDYPYAGITLA